MFRTLIAILALTALTSFANAEPVKAGAELNDFVMKTQGDLDQPVSNLLSMANGLPELEADYVTQIYDAAVRAEEKVTQLFVATKIYTLMVDNRDRASVRNMINLLAAHSIKDIDSQLNKINRNMAKLRAPAVVTEAQRVRDLLVETRDGLQKRTPLK